MVFLPRGGADKEEKGKDDKIVIPEEISILPLRGTVLYPDLILPITSFNRGCRLNVLPVILKSDMR